MKTTHTTDKLTAYPRAILDVIAETIWPTQCCCCNAPGQLLCESCAQKLPFIDTYKACPRCGAANGCVQCCECNPIMLASHERDVLPYDQMASVVALNDDSHRMITTYKDAGERRLAPLIAEMMARYVPPAWRGTTITYIPASKAAIRRRGFDHAELLADCLAEQLHTQAQCLLIRPHTLDQRKLSRQERISNMGRSFDVADQVCIPHKLIVIDDVCTTGATLYAAADALRAGGACKLFGLTFART